MIAASDSLADTIKVVNQYHYVTKQLLFSYAEIIQVKDLSPSSFQHTNTYVLIPGCNRQKRFFHPLKRFINIIIKISLITQI